MSNFIHIPYLTIHNANAMSSTYTIGMPAMTAWLGAMHHLQRQLQKFYPNTNLTGLALASHSVNLQTYKGKGDYVASIVGTANPVDENGNRTALLEEPRCHLVVSLLIEVTNVPLDVQKFLQKVQNCLYRMKFAGGDVLSVKDCTIQTIDTHDDDRKQMKQIIKAIMPCYVLIDRTDYLKQTMQEENVDALDALLSYLKVYHSSTLNSQGQGAWTSQRKQAGWFVPIAVGFQGISELGIAKHQRDPDTPHRFAESVVTLGEYIMPHRIGHIAQMIWRYQVDLTQNLYLCTTQPQTN